MKYSPMTAATIATLLLLAGCVSTDDATDTTAEQTTQAATETISQTPEGTYYANLPCKDCRSMRVDLVLDADGQYEKMVEYSGTNEEPIYESGQWMMKEKTITLTSSKPHATQPIIQSFMRDKNHLILLDKSGKPYPAKLAKRYRFKKK